MGLIALDVSAFTLPKSLMNCDGVGGVSVGGWMAIPLVEISTRESLIRFGFILDVSFVINCHSAQ